jgi:hypothetical protein
MNENYQNYQNNPNVIDVNKIDDLENPYVDQTNNSNYVENQYLTYSTQDVSNLQYQTSSENQKTNFYPVINNIETKNYNTTKYEDQTTQSTNEVPQESEIPAVTSKLGLMRKTFSKICFFLLSLVFFTCIFINILITPYSFPWR